MKNLIKTNFNFLSIIFILFSIFFLIPIKSYAVDVNSTQNVSDVENRILEATGKSYTKADQVLKENGVDLNRRYEIWNFLYQSKYFTLSFDEKILFMTRYAGTGEGQFPELNYIARMDNVGTAPILGTAIKADNTSWYDRFINRILDAGIPLNNLHNLDRERLSGPIGLVLNDIVNAVAGVFHPGVWILAQADNFVKQMLTGQTLDYLYGNNGPLKRFSDNKNADKFPTFTDEEVQLLKGWAQAKQLVNLSVVITTVLTLPKINGGAILNKVSQAYEENLPKTAQNFWGDVASERLLPESSTILGASPYNPYINMNTNSINMLNELGPNSDKGRFLINNFSAAADRIILMMEQYGVIINRNKLMRMTGVGKFRIGSTSTEELCNTAGCHTKINGKSQLTINEDFLWQSFESADSNRRYCRPYLDWRNWPTQTIYPDSDPGVIYVLDHEFFHTLFNGRGGGPINEGFTEIFSKKASGHACNDYYEREEYAVNRLVEKIAKHYNPDLDLNTTEGKEMIERWMVYLAYEKENNLDAAQKINGYFYNRYVYEELDNLLLQMRAMVSSSYPNPTPVGEIYIGEQGIGPRVQNWIDAFINQLQMR